MYQLFEEVIRDNGWPGERLNEFTLNRNNHNKVGLFASTLVVLETTYDMLALQKEQAEQGHEGTPQVSTFIQQATEANSSRCLGEVWNVRGSGQPQFESRNNTSSTTVLLYFTPEPTAIAAARPSAPSSPFEAVSTTDQ